MINLKNKLIKILSNRKTVKNENLKHLEVNGNKISEFIVSKILPVVGYKPFPVHEIMLMVSAVAAVKPNLIIEWGTNIGKSARIFYESVTFLGYKTEIHSIDLPKNISHLEHPGSKRGLLVKNLKNVFLYEDDGLTKAQDIICNCPKYLSFLIFLDGDHNYKNVYRELSTLSKLSPQASFLIHDTFFQSKEAGYNTGPYRAIKKFLNGKKEKYNYYFSGLCLPGMTFLKSRFNRK